MSIYTKIGGVLVGATLIGGGGVGVAKANSNVTADITLDPNRVVQQLDIQDAFVNASLPDATTLSPGLKFILQHTGYVYPFGVVDSTGDVLTTCRQNETVFCYLTDNSTTAGTWEFDPPNTSSVYAGHRSLSMIAGDTIASPTATAINSTHSIVAYRNNTVGQVAAISVQNSDGTVVSGPLNLSSNTAHEFRSVKTHSPGLLPQSLVCYTDTTTGTVKAAVLQESSGSLTLEAGPADVISEEPVSGSAFTLVALDDFNAAVVYSGQTNADLRAAILNWDGTSITVTGPTVLDANRYNRHKSIALNTRNLVVIAQDLDVDQTPTAFSINWDGAATISLNEPLTKLGPITTNGDNIEMAVLEDTGSEYITAVTYQDGNQGVIEIISCNLSSFAVSSISVQQATTLETDNNFTSGRGYNIIARPAISGSHTSRLTIVYELDYSMADNFKKIVDSGLSEWDEGRTDLISTTYNIVSGGTSVEGGRSEFLGYFAVGYLNILSVEDYLVAIYIPYFDELVYQRISEVK